MRRGAGSAAILGVAALSGAAVLVVELSAVRLLAPWFGTSSGVWTNVIGVLLLALALGYALGARLSSGGDPSRRLGAALALAALATGWLPAAAAPVAGFFLPTGLGLDRAAELLPWGSLAASCVLFLPPAVALGAVGPLAVEWLQRTSGGSAGAAGGRVLAASTLGSIAGTFATTYVALPVLGLSPTFLAAAVLLLALALPLCLRRPSRTAARVLAGLAVVGIALGAAGASLARPAARTGTQLLEASQSAYQSVRVVEDEASGMRRLEVNEGFDSFQSVWQPEPGLLPAGYYYNLFALPPRWEPEPRGEPWRLCVLGLGAGTAVRVLEGSLPGGVVLESTGVEIDAEVVRLARRWMDLAPPGTPGRDVLAGWDARAALRALSEEGRVFDQIVVDAYANQVEIPAHLCTVEFFEEVRAALRDGGTCAVNVGGFGLDDPVVEAVAHALARAFGEEALGVRVPFSRNVVLFARRDAVPPAPDSDAFTRGLGPAARCVPEGWWWYLPQAKLKRWLRDGFAPIEDLQRASLARAAAVEVREPESRATRERRLGAGPPAPAAATPAVVEAALVAEDHAAALRLVRGVADPLTRSRLERRVRHHAGDLDGALWVGAQGLEAAPDDPELLLGTADVALALGRAELATELAVRLEGAVAHLPEGTADGAWWRGRAAETRAATEELREFAIARRRALARARRVSIAGLVAASAVLVALVLRPQVDS